MNKKIVLAFAIAVVGVIVDCRSLERQNEHADFFRDVYGKKECQFTFSNGSYVETKGRFPLFSRNYNVLQYSSFLFFFKITPSETKTEKHPQTVLELYDNRRSGGKLPQFLVQVQPFRLYVWGCQLTTAEGGDIKGADLKPGKEHLVKLLLKASGNTVGNNIPVGVHLKINDFEFRGQLRTGGGCTDIRELRIHAYQTPSDPHFRFGGQKNQEFTSRNFKVSFPSSPLEAKVTYLWFYLGIEAADLKIAHENGRPLKDPREEIFSDDTLGEDEGWTWNAKNTPVKAQNCPGGSGLPTTTTVREAIQELNDYLAGTKEVNDDEVKQAIEQLETANGTELLREAEAEGGKREAGIGSWLVKKVGGTVLKLGLKSLLFG